MANNKTWSANVLDGGSTGALDTINGSSLVAGDIAMVVSNSYAYFYLMANDGTAEDSPDVITPDTNPGSLAWKRVNPYLPFNLELSPWWFRTLTGGGTTALDGEDGDDLNLEDVAMTIDGVNERAYIHAFVTQSGSPFNGYVNQEVEASADDGYEAQTDKDYLLFDPADSSVFLVFPTVTISDYTNATISSAKLYLYPASEVSNAGVGATAVAYGAEDFGGSNPPASSDAARTNWTLTTATATNSDVASNATANTPYEWDVTSIVDEIRASGTWSSGTDMGFLIDDTASAGSGDVYWVSYDGANSLDGTAIANLDAYDARYTMDSMSGTTLYDETDNSYDLTATNIGGSGVPVQNGDTVKEGSYSMFFTSANKHVLQQAVASDWRVTSGHYNVISVWVKFNDYTAADQGIISAGGPWDDGNNDENWSLYMYNSGKLCFSICDTEGDVGGRAYTTSAVITDNDWHHILFSFSRPTRFDLDPQCKFYVDAVPVSFSTTATGSLDTGWGGAQPATSKLNIGLGWESDVGTGLGFGSAAMYMDGYIDDVAVYDNVTEMTQKDAWYLYTLRNDYHRAPRLEITYTFPAYVEDSPQYIIPDDNASNRWWTLTTLTIGNGFEIYHDYNTANQGGKLTLKHIDLYADVVIDAYDEYLRVRNDSDSDRFIFEIYNEGSAGEGIKLGGNTIYEWSTDGGLNGNSDTAIPTEQAVKTYVDSRQDRQVAIDSTATAGYIGATNADGVLRFDTSAFTYTDGGDFVTIDVAANGIDDTHIDWGTGANQVSAADVPIADSGSHYTGTDVESALDEIGEHMGFWNGTFHESFDAVVTSDGITVTMSLEQSGGGDLEYVFSDGHGTLDCTPADTIELTAGSDVSPTENFIYLLQSTKALTKSTTDWPSAEHIKVAYFLVPSAGFVQTNGVYVNQNWNDHVHGTDEQGHLSHITEKIRLSGDGAHYHSGVAGNGTSDYITITTNVGTPDNVDFKSTAGVSMQMHRHTIPAVDTSTGSVILVVNDSATAYDDITDLNTLLTDSAGNSMSGKYFNLIFWGVCNKTGEFAPMMCNLPSGSYNVEGDAQNDVSSYDNYSIPAAFKEESSTGFLICRITLKHSSASGGTWTVSQTTDLRGASPGVSVGGATGGAGGSTFADNAFEIYDEGDDTKRLEFEISNITAGNTRTITPADADMTLFSTTDYTDLTDAGATTLHKHDHGNMDGLSDDDHTQYILHSLADAANDFLVASGADTFVKKTLAETGAILESDLDHGNIQGLAGDDHTQYLLADGTRALAGAWNMGSQNLTNVDIDSGSVDGATIGATSASTIVGTTIDATTDFTVGDTIITDGQIADATGLSITAVTTLADTSAMASSAAPAADAQIANKKYVDDQFAGAADEKVKIDAAATAGYLGAASGDGVLRTGTTMKYTDGGDFVTLNVADALTLATSLNVASDGATVTGIKDEDDMSSDSAVKLATQQSIKAYVDNTNFNKNLIYNGCMRVAQRDNGSGFTSATDVTNDDDTWCMDRWLLLSDGNDIVDITHQTGGGVSGNEDYQRLDVETTAKKFGILQVIENANCFGALDDTVSLSFEAKVTNTAKLSDIRAVVLAWDGAADTVTSDIISSWNAEGTRPTYVANWTAENVDSDLNVTDSWARYEIENIAVDTAGATNIGVFIYQCNVATNDTAGVYLEVTNVQLEIGSSFTEFERRPLTTELLLCQRYCEMWDYDTAGQNSTISFGMATTTTTALVPIMMVQKRTTPTVYSADHTLFRVNYHDGGVNVDVAGLTTVAGSNKVLRLNITVSAANLTASEACLFRANSANALLILEAEL